MTYNKYLDNAVAGVIEALLLVALAAIVLSTIQLVYIPEIMEQKESEHMDEVDNQFSYLKSVVDLQSVLKVDVPISSPITLGSSELPYFVTARAFGQLDIIDATSSRLEFDFIPEETPFLTSIQFHAINSYFVDQQYILEGGAVFVRQSDGESVRIEPSITVENRSEAIRIIWQLPEFKSIAGKNSTGGYKNCFIRTNYSFGNNFSIQTTYIKIYSQFLDAWNATFNSILDEAIKNNNITVMKKPINDPQYVEIKQTLESSKELIVYLDKVTISAQIGPGVVIQ